MYGTAYLSLMSMPLL